MSRVIYKYPLAFTEHQIIQAPSPKFVHAGLDPVGHPAIWLEVTPDSTTEDFIVCVVFTGRELPDTPRKHLASFSVHDLMLHLYHLETLNAD